MNVVTDTSVFLAVALNEPEKERVVDITSGVTAMAPKILPYEIGNALSAMVKRHKLSRVEALKVESIVANIAVRLLDVDIASSLQLAIDHNIYAYDAYFLQCARTASAPICTLDRRMKQVAEKLGLDILE